MQKLKFPAQAGQLQPLLLQPLQAPLLIIRPGFDRSQDLGRRSGKSLDRKQVEAVLAQIGMDQTLAGSQGRHDNPDAFRVFGINLDMGLGRFLTTLGQKSIERFTGRERTGKQDRFPGACQGQVHAQLTPRLEPFRDGLVTGHGCAQLGDLGLQMLKRNQLRHDLMLALTGLNEILRPGQTLGRAQSLAVGILLAAVFRCQLKP